jgi:hypothetical protein
MVCFQSHGFYFVLYKNKKLFLFLYNTETLVVDIVGSILLFLFYLTMSFERIENARS